MNRALAVQYTIREREFPGGGQWKSHFIFALGEMAPRKLFDRPHPPTFPRLLPECSASRRVDCNHHGRLHLAQCPSTELVKPNGQEESKSVRSPICPPDGRGVVRAHHIHSDSV